MQAMCSAPTVLTDRSIECATAFHCGLRRHPIETSGIFREYCWWSNTKFVPNLCIIWCAKHIQKFSLQVNTDIQFGRQSFAKFSRYRLRWKLIVVGFIQDKSPASSASYQDRKICMLK